MWVWVGPVNIPPSSAYAPLASVWLSVRPPTRSRASRTSTERPAWRIRRAAVSPARPAPTTITSADRAACADRGRAAIAAPVAVAPRNPRRVSPPVDMRLPPSAIYPSPVRGQRRTVAARGERLPHLILPRLRIRKVQTVEVPGIRDRHLEPRRVGIDELAGGKEHAELLLARRAPGKSWIREPAVRIARIGRRLVVPVEDDPIEERAGADDGSPGDVGRGPVAVGDLEREVLRIGRPRRVGVEPDAGRERL